MKQLFLLLFLFLSLFEIQAQVSKTNNSAATLNGSTTTRTVNYVSGVDFSAGSVVADVDLTVQFLHTNAATCPNVGAFGFNEEINYKLTSPTGTEVRLIWDVYNSLGQGVSTVATYNDINSTNVTVTLDDEAAVPANGTPTSGSFRGEEALSAFDGETPFGTWTVTVIDGTATGNFLLCHLSFTLSITAGALPVDLVDFKAKEQENQINLNWTTASEIENRGFEIERSQNGNTWETIQFVEGQGTSVEINHYEFQDKNPAKGTNYYRLKQIDYDGQFEYSAIVNETIKSWETETVKIYPNPVTGEHLMLWSPDISPITPAHIRFFDLTGKLLQEQRTTNTETIFYLNELPAGVYYVQLQIGEKTWREKVIYL